MLRLSKYYLVISIGYLFLIGCGNNPGSSVNNAREAGSFCQENSECADGLFCYENTCRIICQIDNDCDVENYHCKNSVCLPGKATACGNGTLELGEDCDDGNRTAGDGCNANCNLETGWRCINQKPAIPNSVCNRTTGNCLGHFTGDNCERCESNFTGDNCDQCITGFQGPNCDMCQSNCYGLNCKPCTCLHGECNDTIAGDGFCRKGTCTTGWAGDNCDHCDNGYTGTKCVKITCVNGTLDQETGICSTCNQGWTGDNCDSCDNGYTGLSCVRITCANGTLDQETGTCSTCIEGWLGVNCDTHCDCPMGKVCDAACNSYNVITDFAGDFGIFLHENMYMPIGDLGVDYFYPNGDSREANSLGLLYTYEAALNVCPKGWHLPTETEYQRLIDFAVSSSPDGRIPSVMATSPICGICCGGTDFDAEACGFYDGSYRLFNQAAGFWTSTEKDANNAVNLLIIDENIVYQGIDDTFGGLLTSSKKNAYSVRCFKD